MRYAFRVNIAYVTQTRFPTEKAHGHQIAQVCAAMAGLGHAVTLVSSDIPTAVKEDVHAYYGVPRSFEVRRVHQFNALHARFVPEAAAFAIGMASLRRSLKKDIAVRGVPDLFYARSAEVLSPLLDSGAPVVFELHTLPRLGRARFVRLCNRCRLVVCLTTPMKKEVESWGVDPGKILVEGDGVTLARFEKAGGTAVSRPETDRTILGYVGSLVTGDTLEKGVAQIVDAVAELKRRKSPVFGWIVGGPTSWHGTYRDRARSLGLGEDDIRFDAPVPAAAVAGVLARMDVCAYPAPASNHPFFTRDTSPLKLLEYFAAKRPVVCADIPPIRDLCDEKSVVFCDPGSGASMADAVAATIADGAAAKARVEAAADIAAGRDWGARMARILARASGARGA